MSIEEIRTKFSNEELTWADLLETTGLETHILFDILYDLINPS